MRAWAVGLRSGTDGTVNLALALDALAAAADDGADLVVLPEYASRFDPHGVGREHAEPLDEGFVPALRRAAGERGIAVIAGTTVPTADRAANVVVAIDAAGGLVGIYRKVHLYDAFGTRESDRLVAGAADARPLLVEVGGLVVGVLTCYDLRFPESARRLVDAGATVLAVPAAWAAGEHKADHWRTLLRARAIENTAYVIGAALQGRGVTGESCVVDPNGTVLADSGRPAEPGEARDARGDGARPDAADPYGRWVLADLNPSVIAEVRAQNPSLANRRYQVVPR
jgi:predicted amidohydrolase